MSSAMEGLQILHKMDWKRIRRKASLKGAEEGGLGAPTSGIVKPTLLLF